MCMNSTFTNDKMATFESDSIVYNLVAMHPRDENINILMIQIISNGHGPALNAPIV